MASQSSGLRCCPLKARTQVRILPKSFPGVQGTIQYEHRQRLSLERRLSDQGHIYWQSYHRKLRWFDSIQTERRSARGVLIEEVEWLNEQDVCRQGAKCHNNSVLSHCNGKASSKSYRVWRLHVNISRACGPVVKRLRRLPLTQETWVRFLAGSL